MSNGRSDGSCFEQGLVSGRTIGRCVGARSDKEFISKLGVTIEEADESAYWLEILAEAGLLTAAATAKLLNEAEELIRIFVASRETVRRRLQKRMRERRRSITNP